MRVRPRVGISSCLLGERVRYDGGDKRDPILIETLGRHVELVPFCPEVEAGFGVPREPMHLVLRPGAHGTRHVAVLSDSGGDVTARLTTTATHLASQAADMRLAGFVLKSRSPSCGVGTVPIEDATAGRAIAGNGVFADALRAVLRRLPIEDEVRLADRPTLAAFLERVLAYHVTLG